MDGKIDVFKGFKSDNFILLLCLSILGLDKHLNDLNKDLLRVEKEQGRIRQGHAEIKDALNQLPKGEYRDFKSLSQIKQKHFV
jgi:hypothetical protein